MVDVMSMKSSKDAILIHGNMVGPKLIRRINTECGSPDHWHKFVVGNIQIYDRDFVLKTISDFVYPANLIPVQYVKKTRAFFLARNCLEAILKIAANKMEIPNPKNRKLPLRLVIIANHCPAILLKIDLEQNIRHVLQKRKTLKILDLKEFHKDTDLQEFCLLSQPKLMSYVMQFVVDLAPTVIDLKRNYIKDLSPIRWLSGCNVIALDLGHNEIASFEDLEVLKDFRQLQELNLDGNPLCDKIDQYTYVQSLKKICPLLTVIDHVPAFYSNGFLITKQNFLCSLAGADLTSQFIEHFFTIYDYEKRATQLKDLYHKNAMFSVTCRKLDVPSTQKPLNLDHYFALDRNLHASTAKKNTHDTKLFCGRRQILNILSKLPPTNHDPLQFQCDLMYYTGKHAVISVCGVFREKDQYLNFTRNFVLENEGAGYVISNEQLHVHNSLSVHVVTSHQHPANTNPLPFYHVEYKELEKSVHLMTGLNKESVQELLDGVNYDLKAALRNFIIQYAEDKFPLSAFNQEGKTESGNEEGNISCYPPSIVKALKDKGVAVSPKTVWLEINDKRISSLTEQYNSNLQHQQKSCEKLEEETSMVLIAPISPIPNNIPVNIPVVHRSLLNATKKAAKKLRQKQRRTALLELQTPLHTSFQEQGVTVNHTTPEASFILQNNIYNSTTTNRMNTSVNFMEQRNSRVTGLYKSSDLQVQTEDIIEIITSSESLSSVDEKPMYGKTIDSSEYRTNLQMPNIPVVSDHTVSSTKKESAYKRKKRRRASKSATATYE